MALARSALCARMGARSMLTRVSSAHFAPCVCVGMPAVQHAVASPRLVPGIAALHVSTTVAAPVSVTVPSFGAETIHNGTVEKILVHKGSAVAAGDIVMVVETAKTLMDIKASTAGIIQDIHVKVGQDVKEGEAVFSVEPSIATHAGAAATPVTTAAPAAPAAPAAATDHHHQTHHRVPLIRFRYGKRPAQPEQHVAAPTAKATPTPAAGANRPAATKTYLDLPPMFGRPPLGKLEGDVIVLGGASP